MEELENLNIPAIAANPCFLFLWTGNGGEGLEIGRRLFKYSIYDTFFSYLNFLENGDFEDPKILFGSKLTKKMYVLVSEYFSSEPYY